MSAVTVEAISSPFVPRVQTPDPSTFVLFGATGDLATRKLLPSLLGLWRKQFLPGQFAVVGVGRCARDEDAFRQEVRAALHASGGQADTDDFLRHVHYHRADVTATDGLRKLARRIQDVETEHGLGGNRLFYLAVDPHYFDPVIEGLAAARLLRRDADRPWNRVVVEKPFGDDLDSARELDRRLLHHLRPDQLYRIDHYLGKDTVQNLLAFRFGNSIFEPLFRRQYVDHVQITVAEDVGLEGRGRYYDGAGALRDVGQNHLLQLLALVAMDPPATLKARDLSDAKLKVLRNLVPIRGLDVARHAVRAQYAGGTIAGRPVPAYRDEPFVADDTRTETYVAQRVGVDDWRWAGVPFLLRTGKRLPHRMTEVAVQFKLPPLNLFRTVECEGEFCDLAEARPNALSFRIQPEEGVSLSVSAKRPGLQLDLHPAQLEFDYERTFHQELPEGYERLLLDAMRGDATLFIRSEELEASWAFVTPILQAWQESPLPIPQYAAGTWGPPKAERLAEGCVGGWRYP